ncbi:alpha/beta fold hydrolase [Aureivirga sp. CE67]|uniref:alpha/beta fold hydrolase n=1 Tax=Aureivirga sp. CE67 TaxID=1788983 RepID=UPI0018CB2603|nr:alpha/beta hydrolase [Aureivirga sp. CE67]
MTPNSPKTITVSRYFNYKNAKVHFAVSGNMKGKTIVFLHGFLENFFMWDFIKPEFEKKYKIVTIDLLGHGKTENIGYIHTMEQMADCVREVLKSLKLRKYFLVGHSLGGYVALAMAEKHPKSINGIFLMNSTPFADSPEKKLQRERSINVLKMNPRIFIRVSIANLFSKSEKFNLTEEIRFCTDAALKTNLQGIIAAIMGMRERKQRSFVIENATFPVLALCGRDDHILDSYSLIKKLDEHKIPNRVVEGGHMSHMESREETIAILKEFLAQKKTKKKEVLV